MLATAPNWAEIMTAIGTAVGAVGLVSTLGVVAFGAQQVRESRQTRQAAMAADFLRRWDEHDLVETRRLIGQFASPEDLRDAFLEYVATNSVDAYVLYRELDYFEQLGALEQLGAFDFELVKLLLGHRLIERFELWKPSLDAFGAGTYPHFEALVRRMAAAQAAP